MAGPGAARRTGTGTKALAALVGGLLLLAAAPDRPAAQEDKLEEIERRLEQDRAEAQALEEKAQALRREIRSLRAEMIAAADKAQAHERALSEIEAQLAELEAQEADKSAALDARRAQLAGTLAALQRMARQPPEALIVSPGRPIDVARSALLLRVAIPEIETRAEALRRDLDELAALRATIAERRAALTRTGEALALERARLKDLLARKNAAYETTAAEQQAARDRARRLATEARDLRDLVDRLAKEAEARAARDAAERKAAREAAERAAAERRAREQAAAEPEPAPQAEPSSPGPDARPGAEPDTETRTALLLRPETIRPFPDRGRLRMPASGRVVQRFGQATSDGLEGKGIRIAARPGAQIVAPFDGKVAYAGPFRLYGQILIIEHSGRYHTLLAGLGRIDAVVGQWVLAGEPVGVL
ncbi:MAG TPA: peptidoglycan DD-metalloendopeptidase family protein, partial [Kiloniellales bacterium]|nr:peptidoglycan DD-metalloendopeptidase family protein [Kiloniellales bacterium]